MAWPWALPPFLYSCASSAMSRSNVPCGRRFDELGRLVAALAEAELHVGHRTFHARGLTVGKHQLAVAIHEVDELVDVVAEHRGQEAVAELLHQLLRGDFPDGRDALQGFEHGRGLVAAGQAARADQRPQGAAQWLHFLRYSSASSATGLTGSPSRSVMTVPQSGHAATSPWRVRRW
jgi:hypothetical protein